MENDKLDYFLDNFPLVEENKDFSKSGYWRKYERDTRFFYLFSKNPDYIDEELFFHVMNGIGPDLLKSKIENFKDDKEYSEDQDE